MGNVEGRGSENVIWCRPSEIADEMMFVARLRGWSASVVLKRGSGGFGIGLLLLSVKFRYSLPMPQSSVAL